MNDIFTEYEESLKKGYFKLVDGKKCLKEEFIVKYPKRIADELAYDRRDKRTFKNKNKNKLSQIWKFYDHARWIQDSLRLRGNPLDVLKATLYELMPAAAYALERATITDDFRKFIDLNVSNIKDKEDLDAFVKHFQSLIAYLPRENSR